MNITIMRTRKLIIAIISCLLLIIAPARQAFAQKLPLVPDVDLSKFTPDDFSDEEIDMPYFLKHLHTVANGVLDTGANRGFIDIIVWRSAIYNKPYNARIMENVIAFAYFYSTKRKWNVYYQSEPLRLRLEAALTYLCDMQSADGQFSEYDPQKWNLAATAFATKFLGSTIRMIKDMPKITPAVLKRAIEADRKAIVFLLNDKASYEFGKNYTNQYANLWGGALSYLNMFPDNALRSQLVAKIEQAKEFQSVAGFFYEAGATDFGYNLGTHHSDLWTAWHYSRGTELAKTFVEEERGFAKWIVYNAVKEPGYDGYTLNRAIETRQKTPVIIDSISFRSAPLGVEVEEVRAFEFSTADIKRMVKEERARLATIWPKVDPLVVGHSRAYTPYDFLQRDHFTWHPTPEQKQASINKLPYIASDRFVHQKMDNRNPTVFTYIRRPSYYAIFNSGKMMNSRTQRYGLGLLWHPVAGTFLQSQSWVDDAAWGTIIRDGKLVEKSNVIPVMNIAGRPIQSQAGAKDLPAGSLDLSYKVGSAGKKTIAFKDNAIEVAVVSNGELTEVLPFLLMPQDNIALKGPGKAVLTKSGIAITVTFDPGVKAELKKTNQASGLQTVTVLTLSTKDKLNYTIAL